DRVDLRRVHDAGDDRVRGVGADELGALELDAGLVGVEPDDDLDVGPAFERLRDTSSPIRGKAGHKNAHRVTRTRPSGECATCRTARPAPFSGCARPPP